MAYEKVQKPSSSFVPVQKKVSGFTPSASGVQAKDVTAGEQEQMPKVSTPATDANWLMKHPLFKGNQFLQRVVAPASESESLESEESLAQRETVQRQEGKETGTPYSLPVQAKLTIGEPGDKYEQEADRVAADVVQRIHAPAPKTGGEGALQRQEMGEDEEVRLKSEGGNLQGVEISQHNLKSESENPSEASADLEASIQGARGSGQPLAESVRKPMEREFGADFSGVRVHTDAKSDALNQSIQAKAFTTGEDIFFRAGAYEPGSKGGQELLAHELTHVVQQSNSVVQQKQDEKRLLNEPVQAVGANPIIQRMKGLKKGDKVKVHRGTEKKPVVEGEVEDVYPNGKYYKVKLKNGRVESYLESCVFSVDQTNEEIDREVKQQIKFSIAKEEDSTEKNRLTKENDSLTVRIQKLTKEKQALKRVLLLNRQKKDENQEREIKKLKSEIAELKQRIKKLSGEEKPVPIHQEKTPDTELRQQQEESKKITHDSELEYLKKANKTLNKVNKDLKKEKSNLQKKINKEEKDYRSSENEERQNQEEPEDIELGENRGENRNRSGEKGSVKGSYSDAMGEVGNNAGILVPGFTAAVGLTSTPLVSQIAGGIGGSLVGLTGLISSVFKTKEITQREEGISANKGALTVTLLSGLLNTVSGGTGIWSAIQEETNDPQVLQAISDATFAAAEFIALVDLIIQQIQEGKPKSWRMWIELITKFSLKATRVAGLAWEVSLLSKGVKNDDPALIAPRIMSVASTILQLIVAWGDAKSIEERKKHAKEN